MIPFDLELAKQGYALVKRGDNTKGPTDVRLVGHVPERIKLYPKEHVLIVTGDGILSWCDQKGRCPHSTDGAWDVMLKTRPREIKLNIFRHEIEGGHYFACIDSSDSPYKRRPERYRFIKEIVTTVEEPYIP